MTSSISIPWASDRAQRRVRELQAGTEPGTTEDLDRAFAAVQAHEREMDELGLVLYAGSNATLGAEHDHQLGMRPAMGDPAEKVQPGLEHLETLEVLTTRTVAATMRAPFADVRPQSATIANLAVYTALSDVGDTIAVLPRWAGAHVSHLQDGAAGIRDHRIVELPYDATAHDIDHDALPDFLERERPALLVVGGSLVLFANDLERLTDAARRTGARVLYDASHVAGLIAGRRFTDPLADGVDVVTFSTYKSYGGPAGGAIVTSDAAVAERVARAVYPGLTSNYDAGRLRALGIAATALLRDGTAYADACIESARALAAALAENGNGVLAAERGYTDTHHLAVRHHDAPAAVGLLARARIYTSAAQAPSPEGPAGVLRLGTQELVRRGLGTADMPDVAAAISRVLVKNEDPETVRDAVRAIRARC